MLGEGLLKDWWAGLRTGQQRRSIVEDMFEGFGELIEFIAVDFVAAIFAALAEFFGQMMEIFTGISGGL
jgi:hypothetical protein